MPKGGCDPIKNLSRNTILKLVNTLNLCDPHRTNIHPPSICTKRGYGAPKCNKTHTPHPIFGDDYIFSESRATSEQSPPQFTQQTQVEQSEVYTTSPLLSLTQLQPLDPWIFLPLFSRWRNSHCVLTTIRHLLTSILRNDKKKICILFEIELRRIILLSRLMHI